MKCTLNWLQEHAVETLTIENVKSALNALDIEIEEIRKIGGKEYYICEIFKIQPHPNSNILNICEVKYKEYKEYKDNNSQENIISIVCGAPNVRIGLKTILVLSGTTLPSGLTIKDRNIRGYISSGMLLSYEEFGIFSGTKDGIIDEQEEFLKEIIKEDYIINIGLEANRRDISNVYGLAMELAGYLNFSIKSLYKEAMEIDKNIKSVNIKIQEPDALSMLSTMEIQNIKMKNNYYLILGFLMKIGNWTKIPIVNIGNFITLDLGIPLHLYDRDKISNSLEIKLLENDTSFETLNEQIFTLPKKSLIITNEQNDILVLLGIIGGQKAKISENTRNILIECALFNKLYLIPGLKATNIQNTSTYFYKRGANQYNYHLALKLFQNFVDGNYSSININYCSIANNEILTEKTITLSYKDLYCITGLSISLENIKILLEKYSYKVDIKSIKGETLNNEMSIIVKVPLWKEHINNNKDLIEEIVRLGKEKYPILGKSITISIDKNQQDEMGAILTIKKFLVNNGYKEIISYTFNKNKTNIKIINNIGDMSYVRSELTPTMEEYLSHIIDNKLGIEYNGLLFELSKIFYMEKEVIKEHYNLAIGISLNKHRYPVKNMENTFVNILYKLGNLLNQNFIIKNNSIELNKKIVGRIKTTENYLIGELYNFEIMNIFKTKTIEKPQIYQNTFTIRDYSLIIENYNNFYELIEEIKQIKNINFSLFDQFKSSYGIRIKYLTSDEKTFTKLENQIQSLFKTYKISLR